MIGFYVELFPFVGLSNRLTNMFVYLSNYSRKSMSDFMRVIAICPVLVIQRAMHELSYICHWI